MGIIDNTPDEVREYREAMKVWHLAAAEWLALDPEAVFDLAVEDCPFNEFGGSSVEASWAATSLLTPRTGHVHAPGAQSDGGAVTYMGKVSLDWDDSEAFRAAVGPKPKAPWETPEAQAAFAKLRSQPWAAPTPTTSFESQVADWMRANGWRDVLRVTSVEATGWEGSADTEGYGGEDRFEVTIRYVTSTGRTIPTSLDAPQAASLWNHAVATVRVLP